MVLLSQLRLYWACLIFHVLDYLRENQRLQQMSFLLLLGRVAKKHLKIKETRNY